MRYLDPIGLTVASTEAEAITYARALGIAYDRVGVPIESLRPGDVVITGPWHPWSWLPAHVAIECVPDATHTSREPDLMTHALHEKVLPIGLRTKPPLTERHGSWHAYHECVRWVEWVRGQMHSVVTASVSSSLTKCHVVTDAHEAERVIASLHGRPFSYDFETDSLEARKVTRYGLALANESYAWWIPDTIAPSVLHRFVELLRDPSSEPRASNCKYDLSVLSALAHVDPTDTTLTWDTQPMGWLWRARVGGNDLKSLTRQVLGRDVLEFNDVGGPEHFWEQPYETQALYAAQGDARNSYDLVDELRTRLQHDNLLTLYTDIEQPCTPVLAEMELAGLPLDRARLLDIAIDFERWQHEIITELRALGFRGNPNADADIRRFLFDELGLPVLERTDKTQQPSVKQDVLRRLVLRTRDDRAAAHLQRVCELFLDWSEVDKAMNTFVMPPLVRGWDVFRSSIGQTSVISGRVSTSPNSQNIPGHGRRGVIRDAFVAPLGCEIVDADYAQIEVRIAAHLSQDHKLLADFRNRVDPYARIGSEMGFPAHELTKHAPRRQNLKIVYLAWQYLTSAPMVQTIALKQGTFMSLAECRMYMQGMERSVPEFVAWRSNLIEEARVRGRVEDMFGRRRYVSGLNSIDPSTRDAAAREVANFPPQASAAGIIKGCMPSVQRLYKEAGGTLASQIHDELYGWTQVLTPAQRKEFDLELTKRMLWLKLDVPLEVEIGRGHSWATAKS